MSKDNESRRSDNILLIIIEKVNEHEKKLEDLRKNVEVLN